MRGPVNVKCLTRLTPQRHVPCGSGHHITVSSEHGKRKRSTKFIKIFKQDRQCMEKRNNEERSCNHCCSGEVITVTHPECVSVSLVMQHLMRMRHTLIRGLVRSEIFLHLI